MFCVVISESKVHRNQDWKELQEVLPPVSLHWSDAGPAVFIIPYRWKEYSSLVFFLLLLERIDIDLQICNCRLYHVLVFLDDCNCSSIIVKLFMADDPEDPLGLEKPRAIYSIAYPEYSEEICSRSCCSGSYNLGLCQRRLTAHFVHILFSVFQGRVVIRLGYYSLSRNVITNSRSNCRKQFSVREETSAWIIAALPLWVGYVGRLGLCWTLSISEK